MSDSRLCYASKEICSSLLWLNKKIFVKKYYRTDKLNLKYEYHGEKVHGNHHYIKIKYEKKFENQIYPYKMTQTIKNDIILKIKK